MKEINTSFALSQLKMNSALGQTQSIKGLAEEGVEKADFSQLLQQSIDKVNSLQKQSGDMSKAFELGDLNVSLAEVMIAKEKAGIAFQSVLQVRNKLANAYKEIMAMQV